MSDNFNQREFLREKRKQQQKRKNTTILLIAIAAIVLLLLIIFLPKLLDQKTEHPEATGFSIGDPNAPITVVEFSNFGCSHCKVFSEQTEDSFISQYVDTGDVYFTYVNIPSNSTEYLAAAEAVYCSAEQNRFFEYRDILFTYAGSSGAYSTDNLIKYANSVGMDSGAFQACLESDQYADAYLQDYQYAESVGLTGTPSFLINGDQLVYSSELIPTLDELLQN